MSAPLWDCWPDFDEEGATGDWCIGRAGVASFVTCEPRDYAGDGSSSAEAYALCEALNAPGQADEWQRLVREAQNDARNWKARALAAEQALHDIRTVCRPQYGEINALDIAREIADKALK